MSQTLEHHEHAEHAAQHGNKGAALLIAVLAAALAICEQQAKRADIAVEENSILAVDAWNQYQAKSIRAAIAQDLARLGATLEAPAQPELVSARAKFIQDLRADQTHYERDEKDGKEAIAMRARTFDAERQESLERAHTFDNAAAALELGIVLATASVITRSKMLIRFAGALGAAGVLLGVAAVLAPGLIMF